MKFPEKKPGDSLQASHVNDLNDAACQVVGMKVGGNITKHQSDSFLGLYGNPAWHQYTFEITGNVNSTADGLFKGKIRYWDAVALEWKTNDTEYQIDTTDSDAAFAIGDKVVAYWDKQRCMFLPCSVPIVNQFYNGSTETVPAYAVMAVTDVQTLGDGTVVPKIGKPTNGIERHFLFNGPIEVPIADAEADPPTDGVGSYQDSDNRDVLAIYDTGTPTVGQGWGPKPGQWTLTSAAAPVFTVYGVTDLTNKIAIGRSYTRDSPPWIVFYNSSGYTIPAYGCFSSSNIGSRLSNGDLVIQVSPSVAENDYYLNSGLSVAVGKWGLCRSAKDSPAIGLVAYAAATPVVAEVWGPRPGATDFTLWPGLPGFRIERYYSSTPEQAIVTRADDGIHWAKATAGWTRSGEDDSYVDANPLKEHTGSSGVYDGSGLLPTTSIRIALPQNTTGLARDPNVQAGNFIAYRKNRNRWNDSLYTWIADGNYLDDPIGTVKMWNLAIALIPQGWREYTAMQDRFPIGIKTAGIATAVGATGGAQTHTHGAGTKAGASAGTSADVAANHLPPYSGIVFIERYV